MKEELLILANAIEQALFWTFDRSIERPSLSIAWDNLEKLIKRLQNETSIRY